MTVPVLLISGPIGAGKTTVATEAARLVAAAGIGVAEVDLDALTGVLPRPADDRFNNESRAALDGFRGAVPGAEITLVGLRARQETLLERVSGREVGTARQWHLDRVLELSRQMDEATTDDFVVWTDGRDVVDIAREVLRLAHWPGGGQAPAGPT